HPSLPIGTIGLVKQHHWNDPRLACLHEGKDFEGFVHGAEAPGEKRKGVRFFHEVKFARKEVVEIDELAVAIDGDVRVLLKGKADVETKAVRAAGAPLSGAHDPLAASGNDHVIVRHHLARKFFRDYVLRFTRWSARRSENADFAKLAILGKDLRGVTHFL